jgi:paraquat-inducible protein B
MKTKVSPTTIGLFVLGALALGLVSLLSFGGVNFFSKPQRFVVYFNESIHGLDLGSPVKLRGVRVGRVVDLNIRYDAMHKSSEVAVVCELSRNMITDVSGVVMDVSDRTVLQGMITRGLRAQLGVLGLATGLLYVELDFYDPAEYPEGPVPPDLKHVYIPAVPSAISEYQASLSEILSDLKKVDFADLSKEMKGLLVDTRRQVNKIEVKELISEWTKAAQSVRALTNSPELRLSLAHFDQAAVELKQTLEKLNSQIDPTSAQLNETLAQTRRAVESINATAMTLRRFVSSQQNLGDDASQAFQRLSEASEAIQRLADFLERNPGALLSGRKKPE